MTWQHSAACIGQTSLFFAIDDESVAARRHRERAAKAICSTCTVVAECRAAADEHDEHGIWGGLTEREREQERRRVLLERRRRVGPTVTPTCHLKPQWRTIEVRNNLSNVPVRLAVIEDAGTWHGFRWAVMREDTIVFLAETESQAWLYFHSTVLA